uniref:Sulfotransferase domain-containing protein n=1 Tax=Chrysotila carterae TaxID=13221 RepID=A0A7S4EZI5_CHRCT
MAATRLAMQLAMDRPTAPIEMHHWPSDQPCRPRFMIIGAPKCGSTSLFKYLEMQPQMQQPAHKELCYFSAFKRHMLRGRLGAVNDWGLYVSAFSGRVSLTDAMRERCSRNATECARTHGKRRGHGGRGGRRRAALAAVGDEAAGGQQQVTSDDEAAQRRAQCEDGRLLPFEGCPFYLGEHAAASMIHATFPQLKVIAVVRNPRERTVSAFNDYVRVGRIRQEDGNDRELASLVVEMIRKVQSGERSLEDFDVRLLTSGVYIHGLRKWGQEWPMEQLLLLQAETLFSEPRATVERILNFLNIQAMRRLPSHTPTRRLHGCASRRITSPSFCERHDDACLPSFTR